MTLGDLQISPDPQFSHVLDGDLPCGYKYTVTDLEASFPDP